MHLNYIFIAHKNISNWSSSSSIAPSLWHFWSTFQCHIKITHLNITGKLGKGSFLGRVVMKEKWAKAEISADYLTPAPSFNFYCVFTLLGGSEGNEYTTGVINKKQWTASTSHAEVQNKALSPYFGLLSNAVTEILEQGNVWVTKNNHFSPLSQAADSHPVRDRFQGDLQMLIPWPNVYPHPNTSMLR